MRPLAAEAAELPPLEELVAAGRERALANEEARSILDQRAAERDEAVLSLLPRFSAAASYTRNQYEAALQIANGASASERVVITPIDQLDASLRLDVTILDVESIVRVGVVDARIDAARASARSTQLAVERSVTEAYYQRLAAESIERAAARAANVAELNRGIVETRRAADLGSELDVERARAAVSRAKQTLSEARLQRLVASRKIKTLTGVDASGEGPELSADLSPGPGLGRYLGSTAQVPAVRAAVADLRSADISATAAWLPLVPRVTGFAQERFSNATGFSGQVASWSLGLSAEWRLDPAQFGAARSSAAARRVAEVRLARATEDASAVIEDLWLEVQSRREAALAARAEQAAAKRAALVAKTQFEADRASQIDVIVAERDLLQAEMNRIQADANLELARASLRLASSPLAQPPAGRTP